MAVPVGRPFGVDRRPRLPGGRSTELKGCLKVFVWLSIIAGIAAIIGWAFLFEVHRSTDNVMAPNLVRGDSYLVFILSGLRRGSPAVCEHPREPGTMVVGRIVGGGGDTVSIVRGEVNVNGHPLRGSAEGEFVLVDDSGDGAPLTAQYALVREQSGMNDYLVLTPQRGRMRDMRPQNVPEGDLFLFADNRGSTEDSRTYGTVRASGCTGRPLLIYSPGPSSGDADRIRRWFDIVH
jgi:signal peptidase I